jgi:hypothetical protein
MVDGFWKDVLNKVVAGVILAVVLPLGGALLLRMSLPLWLWVGSAVALLALPAIIVTTVRSLREGAPNRTQIGWAALSASLLLFVGGVADRAWIGPASASSAGGRRPPASYRLKEDDVRAKAVPCQNPNRMKVTPEEIWKFPEGFDAPGRDAYEDPPEKAWARYQHLCVRWNLHLNHARPTGDVIELSFVQPSWSAGVIGTQVPVEEYADLNLGNFTNADVEVQGWIYAVDPDHIYLRDAVVTAPAPCPPDMLPTCPPTRAEH